MVTREAILNVLEQNDNQGMKAKKIAVKLGVSSHDVNVV